MSNGTAALHLCALALERAARPARHHHAAHVCGFGQLRALLRRRGALRRHRPGHRINRPGCAVRRLLEAHPTGHFTGLIPVDFAGLAVNLEHARRLADEFGLWIIEDSCHAPGGFFVDSERPGAALRQRPLCRAGHFQLPPREAHCLRRGWHDYHQQRGASTTTCCACAPTASPATRPTCVRAPDGGWYMEMQELGYNYRLPDLNCALGLSQLARADDGPGPPPPAGRAVRRRLCRYGRPHGAGSRPPWPRLPPLRGAGSRPQGPLRFPPNQARYLPRSTTSRCTACPTTRAWAGRRRRLSAGRGILRALPQHPAFSDADG